MQKSCLPIGRFVRAISAAAKSISLSAVSEGIFLRMKEEKGMFMLAKQYQLSLISIPIRFGEREFHFLETLSMVQV